MVHCHLSRTRRTRSFGGNRKVHWYKLSLQDAGMLFFETRSRLAQIGDDRALRPSVVEDSQPGEQGEGIVIGKPDVAACAGRLRVVEGVVGAFGVGMALPATKVAISLEKALDLHPQFRAGLSRVRIEHPRDSLLDLIALEPAH